MRFARHAHVGRHPRRWGTRTLSLAALLLSLLLPVRVSAGEGHGVRASVTSHGIRLTLRLPGRRFPRGALIRTTVSVTNESNHQVTLGVFRCLADGHVAKVVVLSAANRVVFPPALPFPPLLKNVPCMGPEGPGTLPGESFTYPVFVLLRGNRVQARLWQPPVGVLRTPVIRVQLGPRREPRITLTTHGTLTATVRSPLLRAGRPLYYTDWFVCGHGAGAYVEGQVFEEGLPKSNGVVIPNFTGSLMDWTKVVGNQLQPACKRPSEWHIAAAVLGGTAAYAQYVRH